MTEDLSTSPPGEELVQAATAAALRTLVGNNVSSPGQQGELLHPYPPPLREQANNPALRGSFTYTPWPEANLGHNPLPEAEPVEMSESEGLQRFRSFLEGFIQAAQGNSDDQELVAHARNMLEGTTYIGEQQLQEGCARIATEWKRQLDTDPTKTIYLFAAALRSGTYILDRILAHFDEADLERYRGRLHLVSNATIIKARPDAEGKVDWRPEPLPENNEVYLVDDWFGTTRQISTAYRQRIPRTDGWERANITLQLITAPADAIENGIYLDDNTLSEGRHVSVSAAYTSREMPDGEQCATGIHSSTDDRVEVPIQKMVQRLRNHYGQTDALMPPMTNIVRPYRRQDYIATNLRRVAAFYGQQLYSNQ
jgi:hypothetical protein